MNRERTLKRLGLPLSASPWEVLRHLRNFSRSDRARLAAINTLEEFPEPENPNGLPWWKLPPVRRQQQQNNPPDLGVNFDEKEYARIKPYFDAVWEHAKKAGWELKEFFKQLIIKYGANIKPYAKRFFDDMKAAAAEAEVSTKIPPKTEVRKQFEE